MLVFCFVAFFLIFLCLIAPFRVVRFPTILGISVSVYVGFS